MRRALMDIEPHILHFLGHGASHEGLVFEDNAGNAQIVSGQALANLFSLFDKQIECVVLNGCYSAKQAHAIVQKIPLVVGVQQSFKQEAAIEFAVGFYDALGDGRTVNFAYQIGCNAIELAGFELRPRPVLLTKTNEEKRRSSPTPLKASATSETYKELKEVHFVGSETSVPFLLPQVNIGTFTGRQHELTRLESLLCNTDESTVCSLVGLSGGGGIGKSALATHFATTYQDAFPDGVIGLRVEEKDVNTIARDFILELYGYTGQTLDPEEEREAAVLMEEAFGQLRMLLIFDNADDANALQPLIHAVG
ncbi:MAG: AAA family ATPase, partial [Cyanobacteria bacterium J06576_12]